MANFLASRNNERFRIGDTISINGTKGTIIDMDNNAVTLQTSDRKVIIPLYKFASEQVELFD